MLYESAMARIRRAQAKGKRDVKLSKEELGAMERRRQRESRRQSKGQRIAIPLAQLGAPLPPPPRKRSSLQQSLPQLEDSQSQGSPPMGHFAPPTAPRAPRPRSVASSSSRKPSQSEVEKDQSSSPFSYSYVNAGEAGPPVRHTSDPMVARPRSQMHSASRESLVVPEASPSGPRDGGAADPFQFMTAGSRASYHAGTGPRPPILTSSPPSLESAYSYGSGRVSRNGPSSTPILPSSRRRSEDSPEELTSDEEDRRPRRTMTSSSGTTSQSRPRDDSPPVDIRKEAEPERERERERRSTRDRSPSSKKSSGRTSSSAPVKHKSVPSTSTSSSRKKKSSK